MQYKALTILFATAALAANLDEFTVDTALESLLAVPTWVEEAIASAEPTAWASSLEYNSAFRMTEQLAELAGTMPAWYSSLPESVKHFESTKDAAIYSYELTATQKDVFTSSGSHSTVTATATATATATGSSDADASSISTGGAPAATGAIFVGLAGAAGILGLSLAL
ncbi:hypothetical protein N7520_003738 [Penicillium odoratum]|uniref:uncharacterized protein n=1 Tax=Penicillium odoratum TaxID=1167516 RepID=UPI002547A8F1|nr:uncharacterized protein N7520_003738 [Penicillium odoratum]KAJ5769179.1 hypothetical protein N7520_003738 [Penicillium odoratum]